MRVLIADDSKMMRLLHARSLRQAGYQPEVVEAETGDDALAAIASATPDLVIMDWNMPGMDGVECVQTLRAREQQAGSRPVPVLMITSQSTEEQVLKAKEAGVDILLTKPVSDSDLGVALARLLPERR